MVMFFHSLLYVYQRVLFMITDDSWKCEQLLVLVDDLLDSIRWLFDYDDDSYMMMGLRWVIIRVRSQWGHKNSSRCDIVLVKQ